MRADRLLGSCRLRQTGSQSQLATKRQRRRSAGRFRLGGAGIFGKAPVTHGFRRRGIINGAEPIPENAPGTVTIRRPLAVIPQRRGPRQFLSGRERLFLRCKVNSLSVRENDPLERITQWLVNVALQDTSAGKTRGLGLKAPGQRPLCMLRIILVRFILIKIRS